MAPGLQSPKVILLAKILVSKQKTNQIFIATSEKIKFHLFKKTAYGSFGQGLAMETCKTKAIQAYSDIGRHIKVLFGHIQAYSESFVTLTYLEPWYIQNPGIYAEPEANSEPWYIQNPVKHLRWCFFTKIVKDYSDYFHNIRFWCSLLYKKNTIFKYKSNLYSRSICSM